MSTQTSTTTATSTASIFNSAKFEDVLLLALPFITAIVGSNITGLIPGATGFVLGVVFASLAKAALSLRQNPNSYEDLLSFAITFIGLVGLGISGNQEFAVAGIILGFIAKALPSMANGVNIEDVLLTLGAILAGVGSALSLTPVMDIGFFLSILGKAGPSLGQTTPVPVAVTTTAVKTA